MTKCYYCQYHTDAKGLCHSCVCWTYANSDDEVYKTIMIIIIKGTKQYHIESFIKGNKTFIADYKHKDVLTLDCVPFTPKNIKQKLPIYLTFS